VFLDCDTGVDDSLALGYLALSPAVDLVGVSTVSGNIDAASAARNTLDLLALAGRPEVPVAVGCHDFLSHPFGGGVPHIHGRNGVGNVDLPHTAARPAGIDGAELLIRASHEHAGGLVLLTIAPLTNIARALERDPGLPARIREVVIMGGTAREPGNVTPVAEANIWNDPEAAAIVLAADWDVTLVPLDVTHQNTFEQDDRAALLAAEDPFAVALGDVLDLYFGFHEPLMHRRASYLHDPLAAAIAAGGIAVTRAPRVPVVVDTTDGPGRGQTIADLRGQRHGTFDHDGARVRVVLETDQPLAPHLLEVLLSRTGCG
jgi:purine nucleosidase